ncbi:MAG: hypothetical protein WCG55_00285 [bacterium]
MFGKKIQKITFSIIILSLLLGFFPSDTYALVALWTASPIATSTGTKTAIATSADGTKLLAGEGGGTNGKLWLSTNSGVSWTALSTASSGMANGNWFATAISNDGRTMAAIDTNSEGTTIGHVWTSVDGGTTMVKQNGTNAPYAALLGLAMAVSGSTITIVASGSNADYLYTGTCSTSCGLTTNWTWTKLTSAGSGTWRGVTIDSTGTKIAGVLNGGYIWTGTYSGSWTMTQQTGAGSHTWLGIASSQDGSRLAATMSGGDIWTAQALGTGACTSSATGYCWTDQTGSGSSAWYQIASSADGTKLLAASSFSGSSSVYVSSDSGVTWVAQPSAGSRPWRQLAMSSTGQYMYGADLNTSTNGMIVSGYSPQFSKLVQFSGSVTTSNSFSVTGYSGGLIKLYSTKPGTTWSLTPALTANNSVSFADVQDSSCSGASSTKVINAASSTDDGRNSLIGTGGCWNFTQPYLNFSISATAVDFGALPIGTARYATGNALLGGSPTDVAAHQITIATSGSGGFNLYAQGPSLTSSTHTMHSIGGVNTNISSFTPTTEEFGIRLVRTSGPGTVAGDTLLVPPTAYDYGGNGSGYTYNGDVTTPVIATYRGSLLTTTVYDVHYVAYAVGTTPLGNYSTNITYLAVGNF